MSSNLPAHLLRRELALQERIILTARKRAKVTMEMTAPLWEKVFTKLESRFGSEGIALIEGPQADPGKYSDYCAVSTGLAREINNLPQSDAALLWRQIWSEK